MIVNNESISIKNILILYTLDNLIIQCFMTVFNIIDILTNIIYLENDSKEKGEK